MPLNLDPLPVDGGTWQCKVLTRIMTWPYVKQCEHLALGMLPLEVAQAFRVDLDDTAICEGHAAFIEGEIPDDSPLAKYIIEKED